MSLKSQVVSGVRWSALSNIIKQSLRFMIMVVLARILAPEDFGLIMMTAVFTNFAELLSDLGFAGALIQRQELEERHLSSIFWLNIAIGFALTVLFALLAPLVAWFYNEPLLVPLTIAIAFNFVISSFNDVQTVLLRRDLAFRRQAIISNTAMVFGGVMGIMLALTGFGVWSLVLKNLIQHLIEVVVMWFTTRWRPKLLFDRSAVRELMGFSVNLTGFQALAYWSRNLDGLLIGRFIDSVNLGLYNRAYSTMALPITQLKRTISVVMFPTLARIQDDHPRVKKIALRTHRLIGLVTIPMLIGLALVAEPFMLAVYGQKWAGAIPVLQILCLAGLPQPLTAVTDWVFLSQGRMDIQLRWAFISTGVMLVSFLVGVNWGITGVALAYVVPNYLLWPFTVTLSGRLIGLTLAEYAANVVRPFIFALIMAAGLLLIGSLLPANLSHWLVLLIEVSAGVIIYGGLVIGFNIQSYRDLCSILQREPKSKPTRKPAYNTNEQPN